MPRVVVDCHSHVFNAEDLPIDGFIKRQSPAPALLTGILSLPLDRLSAWAAPGSKEAERLVAMICSADPLQTTSGLEGVAAGQAGPDAATGEELISDEELDRRLVELWPHAAPPPDGGGLGDGGLESVGRSIEEQLTERIETVTPEQRAALDAWLREWSDPEADLVLARQDEGLESVGDVLAKARAVRWAVRRYVAALRLITRHRHLVAAAVASTYPQVRLFAPALVDFDHTAHDKPSTPVHEQVTIHSLVSKLSVVRGIPGAPEVRVHPFVAFCPYREVEHSELAGWEIEQGVVNPYIPYADPATATDADRFSPALPFDAARAKPLNLPVGPWCSARLELGRVQRSLDLVRHAVELGGFAGVKLYPPSGFLPIGNVGRFGERRGSRLDAALRALYGYCVAQDVPILTHAAHSNGFETGYDDLASPAGWEQVLREYPTLRVCFGHFGHLHGVGKVPSEPSSTSWPVRFLELVDAHPHVYADVGNSRYVYDEHYRVTFDAFLGAVLGPRGSADPQLVKRRRRLMFGSDYWMNTLGPDHNGALDVFTAGIEGQFGPDIADWFLGANALRWLGLTGEDDAVDLASRSRTRLVGFYGQHSLPDWLGG